MPQLHLLSPKGFRAAGVSAGIKTRKNARDIGLLVADEPSPAAAVFTTNKVFAAPVKVGREHVAGGRLRGVVVNSRQRQRLHRPPGRTRRPTHVRAAGRTWSAPSTRRSFPRPPASSDTCCRWRKSSAASVLPRRHWEARASMRWHSPTPFSRPTLSARRPRPRSNAPARPSDRRRLQRQRHDRPADGAARDDAGIPHHRCEGVRAGPARCDGACHRAQLQRCDGRRSHEHQRHRRRDRVRREQCGDQVQGGCHRVSGCAERGLPIARVPDRQGRRRRDEGRDDHRPRGAEPQ